MTIEDVRLIVRLVRRDQVGIARCLEVRPDAINHLAGSALAEGLAVVLLRALPSLPPDFQLSAPRLDALESQRQIQDLRSTTLADALAHLADALAAADQEFLLLKGPYLAARFYGDVRGREFVDLDLLVPGADRGRVWRLLESAGYARRSRVIGGEAITSFFVHGFDFVAGDVNVDVHWCLSRHPSVRVDERRLWSARDTYALDGRVFGVLSAGHEVVFHALSLLRDIERGRPKAKNIVDIIQVVAASDATLDWEALFDCGRGDGTQGPLVNVLSLCLDLADAHDVAPRLSRALDRRASRVVPARPAGPPCRFAPTWMDIGNRWWAARAYDTTPLAWFCWWGASLPFRTAVHRRSRPVRTGPPP